MNYLQTVMMHCINQFNGERSVNAVYYLLQGKKSSQTIQDAAWYSLKNLFKCFPDLKKEHYRELVKILVDKNLLVVNEKTAKLTEVGKITLKEQLHTHPLPKYIDGWQFHDFDELFWKRLSLIVQTVSNWSKDEVKFLPVQRDQLVQYWTKQWFVYMKQNFNKKLLVDSFYRELNSLFSKSEQEGLNPEIIVYRFTGYKEPGQTSLQLASLFKMDAAYYSLAFLNHLHFIISTIWNNRDQYPILFTLVKDGQRQVVLTQSTMKTLSLIHGGKSIGEIAKIRHLKKSTIEDHIVEIALMDQSFKIDSYVHPEMQRKISHAVKQLQTRKLKDIKEHVVNADYFSIRLVLAKWND